MSDILSLIRLNTPISNTIALNWVLDGDIHASYDKIRHSIITHAKRVHYAYLESIDNTDVCLAIDESTLPNKDHLYLVNLLHDDKSRNIAMFVKSQ